MVSDSSPWRHPHSQPFPTIPDGRPQAWEKMPSSCSNLAPRLQARFGDSLLGSPVSPAADSGLSSDKPPPSPVPIHPLAYCVEDAWQSLALGSSSSVPLFLLPQWTWPQPFLPEGLCLGPHCLGAHPLGFKSQLCAWGSTAPSLSGEDYDSPLCPHLPTEQEESEPALGHQSQLLTTH